MPRLLISSLVVAGGGPRLHGCPSQQAERRGSKEFLLALKPPAAHSARFLIRVVGSHATSPMAAGIRENAGGPLPRGSEALRGTSVACAPRTPGPLVARRPGAGGWWKSPGWAPVPAQATASAPNGRCCWKRRQAAAAGSSVWRVRGPRGAQPPWSRGILSLQLRLPAPQPGARPPKPACGSRRIAAGHRRAPQRRALRQPRLGHGLLAPRAFTLYHPWQLDAKPLAAAQRRCHGPE